MVDIYPLDDVWVRIDAPDAVLRELSDYFTFETPGAQYMRRKSQYRKWDGRIRLFKLKTRTLYRGLTARIEEFCEQRNYACTNHVPAPEALFEGAALDEWLQSMQLPLSVRDYQYAALRNMLDNERAIILSSTGSGKSYIIYLITQLLNVRTLLVVPTVGLVSQMAQDFKEYGFDPRNFHTIKAGSAKDDESASLYISTWQSIYQQPSEYFQQFDCIIVDEVHQAKAKSLSHLLEQATTTKYRFGFTGTLDDTEAHQLILEGLFGSVTRVATTKDLIKQKHLTPLRVRGVVLHYPDAVRKQLRGIAYPDEVDYIISDRARLSFVAQLAASLSGNVLVLFNFVEKHGEPLYERIRDVAKSKDVHFIAGRVDGDEREGIRQQLIHTDDHQVLVGSYGTFSTGQNVPNLRHIVFASPSKSKIRVLQSIGRGLRLHASKNVVTLWDLWDDLRHGKHVNYAMRHAEQRVEYYTKEQFPIVMSEISLERFAASTGALASSPDNASV